MMLEANVGIFCCHDSFTILRELGVLREWAVGCWVLGNTTQGIARFLC